MAALPTLYDNHAKYSHNIENLFDRGIHLVHGLRASMKNRLMSMWRNHAKEEVHHRVYQRPAEEQGRHRTFKAQINTQFRPNMQKGGYI